MESTSSLFDVKIMFSHTLSVLFKTNATSTQVLLWHLRRGKQWQSTRVWSEMWRDWAISACPRCGRVRPHYGRMWPNCGSARGLWALLRAWIFEWLSSKRVFEQACPDVEWGTKSNFMSARWSTVVLQASRWSRDIGGPISVLCAETAAVLAKKFQTIFFNAMYKLYQTYGAQTLRKYKIKLFSLLYSPYVTPEYGDGNSLTNIDIYWTIL